MLYDTRVGGSKAAAYLADCAKAGLGTDDLGRIKVTVIDLPAAR